jgi:hypothetical protein
MPPLVYSTSSMNELEGFMIDGLCDHEKLDRQQVRIQRSVMRKGLAIVGLVIRIEGPRLMRSQALWVEPENRILFYNSAGQRFATVKLAEAPEMGQLAA